MGLLWYGSLNPYNYFSVRCSFRDRRVLLLGVRAGGPL